MSNTKTGGPAFPLETSNAMLNPGMTLRDYFAAKAMQGFAAADDVGWKSIDHIAETAYEWADAMLKAREE